MAQPNYVDCEFFLAGRHHARLSVAGRDYSGSPALDSALERRLLEVDLEPELYGASLFQALFPKGDDLLVGYQESLVLARHEGKRLRLRLHVATAAPRDLHDLHWELLYDPRQKIALARSQETAFSRYLGIPLQSGKAVVGRPKLLVVSSCPKDLADYDLPIISRGTMQEAIELSLAPLAEVMAWAFFEGPATVERVRDRIIGGEFHALHLAAHGLLPSSKTATARLALETEDGLVNFVDEEIFAEVFAGQRDLRLVSLIACHSGVPASRNPFSGLGPALVERGVPAVVAMRRQISVSGATRWTEHFYRNLARSGRVDVAANEARQQLFLGQSDSPEWSTPTLFMRLQEGQLWDLSTDADESREVSGSASAIVRAEVPETRAGKSGEEAEAPVLRTLLLCDLVGRTRLSEELGDRRMAEIIRRYDRLARDLLKEHGGLEAGRETGFLMLFERPIHAVRWALAFHHGIAELSRDVEIELAFRIGIHLGEVILIETSSDDVARGAKPLAVEGLARPTAARLMALAQKGQTLLSAAAFDLARRSAVGAVPDEQLSWLAHGEYHLPGSSAPVAVYEVGIEGSAPLSAPGATEGVRRALGDQTILGWRPGIGLEVPLRPHWVLEKKLSEGGFGEVWLARHEKMRQQRVLKFCFEAERLRALQREITLFRLLKEELGDRDDIARILDWNFDQAPYFIESEYAADGDLVEWAEEQGGIESVPMEQRLEIVAQLATALSAAHSVGVLHKDVKPANVLIAGGANGGIQVRLADFGIGTVTGRERLEASGITVLGLTAKTEDDSSYSGTRLYMAPELLEGKPATLQADIYALGVMLYQVVVGDFSRALAPGWRRDIDDELLREDITLAVDGSSERRLGNALRIAERLRSLARRRRDREAELREREQIRRQREALEQSRKRRKLMALVIGVLALFAGAMGYQNSRILREVERTNREAERANQEANRANQEANRANQEAQVAHQVSRFLIELFEVSDPAVSAGETVTARELLDQGAAKVRTQLAGQPLTQARFMDTMGKVYHRLALYESAEALLIESIELREEVLGAEHPDLIPSLLLMARLYRDQGRYEEAEPSYERVLAISGRPTGSRDSSGRIEALNGLGVLFYLQGRYEEAESIYMRSLNLARAIGVPGYALVAKIVNNIAILCHNQGRYEEAVAFFQEALGVLEKEYGSEHPEVATAIVNIGVVYMRQERYDMAELFCSRAVLILEKVLGSNHPDLARALTNLAEVYKAQSRFGRAEGLYRRAVAILEKSIGGRHSRVGVNLINIAELYRLQGRLQEAESYFKKALVILEDARGSEDLYVAFPLHGLAMVYSSLQPSQAEEFFQKALAIREEKLPEGHPDLQDTLTEYAALLRAMGRSSEAGFLEIRVVPDEVVG